jgi:hypothetical protein
MLSRKLLLLPITTYFAILKFNDGDISFLKILSDLDINAGIFTSKGAGDCNRARMKLSAKKVTEKVKNRRKTSGHLRKHILIEWKQ